MQAVGQFHQDHADIMAHRHDHLAEVLRLFFFRGVKLHHRDLADTINEFGNAFTESLFQVLLVGTGILDHVMQQGCLQGLVVHVHLAEDVRNFQRVMYIGFTAQALLALVRLGAKPVGPLDLGNVAGFKVVADQA